MQKADNVPAGEEQNFVEYALQWYAVINHHHELVFIVGLFKNIERLMPHADGKRRYTTRCTIQNSARTPSSLNIKRFTLVSRILRNI
jgi:hypothetical protein